MPVFQQVPWLPLSIFASVKLPLLPACCAVSLALFSARAAETSGPNDAAARDAYNAVLQILRSGEDEKFAAAVTDFRARFGAEVLVGELRLEGALGRAGQAWRSRRAADFEVAANALREYTREFAWHPRIAEARLALAELAAFGPEPELDTARNQLRLSRAANPAGLVAERGDLLAIRLAAEPGSAADPVALAEHFLKQYPESTLTDSVRFTRAEELFRRGDANAAGIAWERLAEERPDSSLVPAALLGAGEAALRGESSTSLERAATLFESVAGITPLGPLRAAARLGQARAKLRLGRAAVGLLHCDSILLGEEGVPLEATRLAAELTRGEALLRLSADDPLRLPEAVAAFRSVVQSAKTPPEARRQALTQLGETRRRVGDKAGAIDAWREALRLPPTGGQDTIWFARAGFNAAQALQELERWREAAVVYEALAQAGGALKTEAEARLAQLRLAHFLWPQPHH